MGGVASSIGSVIRQGAGIGDVGGVFLGDKLDPNGAKTGPDDPENLVPQIDPRIINIRDQQLKQATDFRNNLGNYKQAQGTAATDNARRSLASDLSGVTASTNKRGLLYSGLRQGAEAGERAKVGAALNQRQYDIGQSADTQANALDAKALQSGMSVQGLQQGRENEISNRMQTIDQQKQKARNGLIGGVMQGVGSMFGGSG